jgi:DNA invertase Pin-like site-specific DNA recombinase
MNTLTYVGYLRVSTERQGVHGVSLQAQRDAILAYARLHYLVVDEWFEERESAAHTGRPIFQKLVEYLKAGKARGVVFHKIDRGARNLRDWVDLMDLLDLGLEVHLAGDNLDLTSRSGRLAADIQAVNAQSRKRVPAAKHCQATGRGW